MDVLSYTGRMHGNLSAVTIRVRHTKGKFMPGAFNDIALETTLVAGDLPSKVYSLHQLKGLKQYAVHTLAANPQLTTRILHSFLQGKTPVVVSCGINGLCNNWPRLDAFASKLTRQYGGVDIVVRHTGEEFDVEEEVTLAERICPEELDDVYYGIYSTGDIAACGMGGPNHGLLAWRQVLEGIQRKNQSKN